MCAKEVANAGYRYCFRSKRRGEVVAPPQKIGDCNVPYLVNNAMPFSLLFTRTVRPPFP